MKLHDLTWRSPVTIDSGATIVEAAALLADDGVGALIVLDDGRPVGIVTDRDIVVRGIAKHVALDARIDSLMSMGIFTLDVDADVNELYTVFERHAVRRVPVVDHDQVVGMVSLDDAIVSTGRDLSVLSSVLSSQIAFPHATDEPPVPSVVS